MVSYYIKSVHLYAYTLSSGAAPHDRYNSDVRGYDGIGTECERKNGYERLTEGYTVYIEEGERIPEADWVSHL